MFNLGTYDGFGLIRWMINIEYRCWAKAKRAVLNNGVWISSRTFNSILMNLRRGRDRA